MRLYEVDRITAVVAATIRPTSNTNVQHKNINIKTIQPKFFY